MKSDSPQDFRSKIKLLIRYIYKFGCMISDNYTAACAAQAAFFMLLSIVPLVSLALALTTYLPYTQQDVLSFLMNVIPDDIMPYVKDIIRDLYARASRTVISVSAIAMIWSASRGIVSLMDGFNSMYQIRNKYTPLFSRAVSVIYTVIIIVLFALIMSVYVFVSHYYKLYIHMNFQPGTIESRLFLFARYAFGFLLFYGFILMMYVVLPGGFGLPKDDEEKIKFRKRVKSQMAGAAFCSIAWLIISQVIVIYIKLFPNFSVMYGSLAGIVLVMLWLYFCMYSLFIGAVINYLLSKGYLTEVKKMLQ